MTINSILDRLAVAGIEVHEGFVRCGSRPRYLTWAFNAAMTASSGNTTRKPR